MTLLIQSTFAEWILKQLAIIYSILPSTVSRIKKDILTFCDVTVIKLLLHDDKSLDLVTLYLVTLFYQGNLKQKEHLLQYLSLKHRVVAAVLYFYDHQMSIVEHFS